MSTPRTSLTLVDHTCTLLNMQKLKLDESRCTFAWAAEHLGVSVQQVGRYARDGVLTVVVPKCGQRESTRRWLSTEEVRELRRARAVVGRG